MIVSCFHTGISCYSVRSVSIAKTLLRSGGFETLAFNIVIKLLSSMTFLLSPQHGETIAPVLPAKREVF